MAWDHISSDLDSRESAFELHANGGLPTWRNRLRGWFDRYNELANGVMGLLDMEMPTIDMTSIRIVPPGPRRSVSIPTRDGTNSPAQSASSTTT
jgi:4-hydroxyphenylacetate 3-monooxygenase